MCFPGERLPMKRTHPQNLFQEMLVHNVFSWAAAANETKPPSNKSLRRNARRVEFKEEKRRGFLLTFSLYFPSLLSFSLLQCEGGTLLHAATKFHYSTLTPQP
jgi:hypothetical protein